MIIPPLSTFELAGHSPPTVGQLGEKLGILVVDDEHLVRVMVQVGLERTGIDVWLAS
jgi:hypothetical protein